MISKFRKLIFVLKHIAFVLRVKVNLIPAFFQVRLFRNQNVIKNRYNWYRLVSEGKIDSNIAVIAIYPEDNELYLISIQNLVEGLIDSKFSPVVVSNGAIPSNLLRMLESKKVTILLRRNYGRDFAAYKYGILWVTRNFEPSNIQSLICVNDTLNWPNSSRHIIEKSKGQQWGGMYLNLADNTHVNSFYMRFDASVINGKSFLKFWKRYLPSQYKRHAIHKGEIKLSTVLLKEGFLPKVIVTADYLRDSIKKVGRDKLVVLFELPNVEIGPSLDHFFKAQEKLTRLEEISESATLSTSILRAEVLDRLLRVVYKDSPHSLGLHMFVLELFPTKRDLYKYYPLGDISKALSVHSEEFAALVVRDFERTMTRRMIGLKKQAIMRKLGEA
jgi:hypothetical protein